MSMRMRHTVTYAIALALVVIVAFSVGKIAADRYNETNNRHYLQARRYTTDALIGQMNSINVGDIIPDYPLHTLTGDEIRLSNVLKTRTLLLFLDASCPSCLDQLEMIRDATHSSNVRDRFLITSRSEPWQLRQIQSDLRIVNPILWDSVGAFHDRLNIHSSPFSVLVDESGLILSIVSGGLLQEELSSIVDSA